MQIISENRKLQNLQQIFNILCAFFKIKLHLFIIFLTDRTEFLLDTLNVRTIGKLLLCSRVPLDLPDPLDLLELPVVDSTSSASLFRRRLPIPSVEATTALTIPT